MMRTWQCILVSLMTYLVSGHVVQNEMELKKEHAKALKEKWSAEEVFRDLHHIKEDMNDIVKLSQAGVITLGEGYFYYFRMHDFDENDGLDGLEMYFAMMHLGQHDMSTESQTMLIDHIDEMLLMDSNRDGFLSYTEMKHHMPALRDDEPLTEKETTQQAS